jgi:hypothetical protein
MKLKDNLLRCKALLLERPTWQITCVVRRYKPFGAVCTEVSYEIAAASEDEAREAVMLYLRNLRPRCFVLSMHSARKQETMFA